MLPDRVLNPGPLTYESGALPIVLRSPDSEKQSVEANTDCPVFQSVETCIITMTYENSYTSKH